MRPACYALAVFVGCGAYGAVQAQSPAGHAGHEGHTTAVRATAAARVLTPAPVIGDIPLLDSGDRTTSLRAAVDTDGPVFVNFIFTTCTTVCPVMSAGFAQFHDSLGADRARVRLVSVSIDPDVDTTATLRAYAARHRAGASWQFLTGSRASIEAAQRAFGAYRGDKSNHAPATYFRLARNGPWNAVDGLSSAGTLLTLVHGPAAHGQH